MSVSLYMWFVQNCSLERERKEIYIFYDFILLNTYYPFNTCTEFWFFFFKILYIIYIQLRETRFPMDLM